MALFLFLENINSLIFRPIHLEVTFATQKFLDVTGLEENQFMLKKWIYYASITLIIAFTSSGFKSVNNQKSLWLSLKNKTQIYLPFSSQKTLFTPTKSFFQFKEAIGFKESQGQYELVNPFGYMGKYQFGKTTLEAVGIYNELSFIGNPKLQEVAFTILLSKNKAILEAEINAYCGKVIDGIKITESGILAAAHLCGASSVKKYLNSNGRDGFKDGFGTNLTSYLNNYGGYDTSVIIANANANIKHTPSFYFN